MKNGKIDIKAVRKHLGLSQQEMATRLGIRQSFLSAIENGKSPLPAGKAVIISDMLAPDSIDMFIIAPDSVKNDAVSTPFAIDGGETNMLKELLNYFHTQAHREQDEHHVNMHRQLDSMQERIDRLVEKNDVLTAKNEQLAAKVETLREDLHSARNENLRLKEILLSNGIKF